MDDEEKCLQYFRLSQYQFNESMLCPFFSVSLYLLSCKSYKNEHSRTNSINFSLSMMEVHLDMFEHDNDSFMYGLRCGRAPHLQTRSLSDKYSFRESRTETDRAASCRKRLKHDDMNAPINTVLKNICRAGNATCMKRSVQDDMNGP
jgi:hypothetical protein